MATVGDRSWWRPGVSHAFAGFCGAALVIICIAFADSSLAKQVRETVTGLATAGAAVFGAVIAWRGVDAWRVQLRGQAVFDACYKASEAVTRGSQQLDLIRTPIIGGDEAAIALRKAGKDPSPENIQEGFRLAPIRRFNALVDRMKKVEDEAVRLRALLGPVVDQLVRELRLITVDFRTAFDNQEEERSGDHLPDDVRKEMREALTTVGGANNKFTQRVHAAVAALEDLVRPYLRERVEL